MNRQDADFLVRSAKALVSEAKCIEESYRVRVESDPQFGTFDTNRDGRWAKGVYERYTMLAKELRRIART